MALGGSKYARVTVYYENLSVRRMNTNKYIQRISLAKGGKVKGKLTSRGSHYVPGALGTYIAQPARQPHYTVESTEHQGELNGLFNLP